MKSGPARVAPLKLAAATRAPAKSAFAHPDSAKFVPARSAYRGRKFSMSTPRKDSLCRWRSLMRSLMLAVLLRPFGLPDEAPTSFQVWSVRACRSALHPASPKPSAASSGLTPRLQRCPTPNRVAVGGRGPS